MRKKIFIILTVISIILNIFPPAIYGQRTETIKYGDFQQWVVRKFKESRLLGGKQKTLYAIGPTDTIEGAQAYKAKGGSQWASSNVFANPVGINKGSNAVFPDKRGNGNIACKLTTMFDSVKVIGFNIDVLVGGSIFLGEMMEPLKSTKNPYSKMNMGVPFTKRPVALQFDYKVNAPNVDHRIYCSGFSKRKTLEGRDSSEVFIILQRRWEDANGNIYAKRVGTGRERFYKTTDWVNDHQLPILYGDITGHPEYKPWMGLIPESKNYYAKNSKGKMVPVKEVGWDEPNATPTHMMLMASAACGTAYVGTPGQTLWVDNFKLVY